MYCQNCGQKLSEGAKFCSNCGTQVETISQRVEVVSPQPNEARCWSVFARVGFGLGLGGLIGCILFGLGFIAAIPGIVFSALGKKSSTEQSKAKTGLVLSIVGTAVGIIIYYTFILYEGFSNL